MFVDTNFLLRCADKRICFSCIYTYFLYYSNSATLETTPIFNHFFFPDGIANSGIWFDAGSYWYGTGLGRTEATSLVGTQWITKERLRWLGCPGPGWATKVFYLFSSSLLYLIFPNQRDRLTPRCRAWRAFYGMLLGSRNVRVTDTDIIYVCLLFLATNLFVCFQSHG